MPLATLGGTAGHVDRGDVARVDGMTFGYASVLASAWGRPSQALGQWGDHFDPHCRVSHLPGPPFLFVSRIARVEARPGAFVPGSAIEAEYDVPPRAWYFEQNGAAVMPFAVVLEAMLQPCGWLSFFIGSTTELLGEDMLFRNLEGTATLHAEVDPQSGPLRSHVRLIATSPLARMRLFRMEIEMFTGARRVADVRTEFGAFPAEAFLEQPGLSPSETESARVAAPSPFTVDLRERPARYFDGRLRLPGPMLLMLHRVTGYWPDGGPAGLGYVRAEKDIDPSDWYFKAHFYQDPVQPGSLGLEALCQLLQFYMIERGLGAGIPNARFQTPAFERPFTWKYRGQVVPENSRIVMEIVVTETGGDETRPYAIADGWLWVDGTRVYRVSNLAVAIVAGPA